MLLRKEDEARTVELGNLARAVVANAVGNALRGKGKREKPLFRKRGAAKAPMDKARARDRFARIQAKIDRGEL